MSVIGCGILVIGLLLLGWVFYMMTCRTEDWLKLVKDEEERKMRREELKGKRDARIGAAAKGVAVIAKLFMKK
jgi:hypothetical protein